MGKSFQNQPLGR